MKRPKTSPRRVLTLLGILSLALLIAACGGAAGPSPQPTAAGPAASGATAKPATPAYPTKPINLIVPYSPGGSSDNGGRLIAAYAAEKFGQPVNVINRPGGSGTIGQAEWVQAPADGYTMLLDTNQLPAFEMVLPDVPFHWENRIFVARVFNDPITLVVPAASQWKTLKDVVEAAKKDPKSFVWASNGPAGGATVSIGWLLFSNGVEVKQTRMVTIASGGDVMTALAGNQISFGQGEMSAVLNIFSTGKIRPLAIITPQRSPKLPDVPTITEAGFGTYRYELINFVSAQTGTPQYVIDAWSKVLSQAAQDPKFQKQAEDMGKQVIYGGPDEAKKSMYEYNDIFLKAYPAMGFSKSSAPVAPTLIPPTLTK